MVDDDPSLTTLFRIVLEREGHLVQTANDGDSAVRIARQFKPDVVLLDIHMPGISGAEIARRISPFRYATVQAGVGYASGHARRSPLRLVSGRERGYRDGAIGERGRCRLSF